MKKTPTSGEQGLDELFEKFRQAPDSYVFVPLADACRKLGRLDEALEICQRGVERHPGYASGHVVRGKCLYDRGEYDAARNTFEGVLDVDDNNLVALKFLGMIEADAGELDAAQTYFQKILAIDPENKDIKRILRDVEEREQADSGVDVLQADSGVDDRGTDGRVDPGGVGVLEATAPVPSAEDSPGGQTTDAAQGEGGERVSDEHDGKKPDEESSARGGAVETSAELASITLADIFASQGYVAKAAKIYREVLNKDTRNEAVRKKLDELSRASGEVCPGHDDTGREPSTLEDEIDELISSGPTESVDGIDGDVGSVTGTGGDAPATTDASVAAGEPTAEPSRRREEAGRQNGTMPVESGDENRPEIDETDSLSHFRQWLKQIQQ